MKSKHFYSLMSERRESDLAVLAHWEEIFNLPIDFDWKEILKFKFKTIKNNKVKHVNFRILHRILPFRYNLCKWKIVNENLCAFCKTNESFGHVLLECPKVVFFWKRVAALKH